MLIKSIPPNLNFSSTNPFCDGQFHQLLEDSKVIGGDSGWEPIYFEQKGSILPGYLKSHSFGEYIFDWAWAELYQRNGYNYYPKLVHCLPFTPVNASKVLGNSELFSDLICESNHYVENNNSLTGEHYLFISYDEAAELKKLGFQINKTLQYHFFNKWSSFDEYLSSLKSSRKKMIKKERKKVKNYNLNIEVLDRNNLTLDDLKQVYLLYISTIVKKNSYAYLNENFFLLLSKYMQNSLKIIVAKKEDSIIAMAIFFQGSDRLYGRYWGIHPKYENDFPLLHFELCYYQGMEICIENNLSIFEAGAQGEQKLWRGFKPEIILSAHKLKASDFQKTIYNHIKMKSHETESAKIELERYLPFSK